MNPKNRKTLDERVTAAAEAALASQHYVGPIDVLLAIGWLDPSSFKRWRQGRVDYLERVIQTSPPRISEAMTLLRSWAAAKRLTPSEAHYVAQHPGRQRLRFSESGNASIEQLYRTHWVSPALPEKKRQRLGEKASRSPELVVIEPLNDEWKCHRCGGTGGLLMMEDPGSACLRCVDLDDLVFLPSGDALLTRRVKANSTRYAVVVRFSRTRKRYERQGLLVEPQVLAETERELR